MKFTLSVILSLVLMNGLFAQNNCSNDISTNPDDPANSMLPNTDTQSDPFSQDDPRFINSFDWTLTNYIQLQNMQQNQNMLYLHNASAPYYGYIYNGEEMTPENGWELMLYNVGSYPDLSDNTDGQSSDIPYIALYNRFTGVLRVFAVYGDGFLPIGISFDGVLITLKFDNNDFVNGNLRLTPGADVALDKPTSTLHTTATALHTNSPNKWFSADFQLTYDPCICYYPSDIRLKFDFLEKLDLNLYGRSITIADNIADGNNLLTNNFLSNFQFNGTDSDDQIIMYRVMGHFVDDYINKMEKYKLTLASNQEYNKNIERKLFIANLFKSVIVNGAANTVNALTGLPWFTAGAQFVNEMIPPVGADSAAIATYRQKLKKAASKIFGEKVDSFIEKNFEKKKNPEKPGAPMASFTELKMTGEITNNTSINGPKFFTPGSYGTEGTGTPTIVNPLEYPIYNNAVGVFALLNTPKIKAYKGDVNVHNDYYNTYNSSGVDSLAGYRSWSHNYQFQLDNEVYYALNDLDVKSHDLQVSMEISGRSKKNSPTYLPINDELSCFIDHPNTINLVSDDVETDEYYPIHVEDKKGYNNGANYCFTPPFTGLQCTFDEMNVPTNYNKDIITFNSGYFPLDAISPTVFSIGLMNQWYFARSNPFPGLPAPNFNADLDGYQLEDIKVRFKTILNVEYLQLDENGENITGTYMFTYDVDDIEWVTSPLETDLQNSSVNYSAFKENLVLNTTDFDGSTVQGCKLVGTHYTCHGWDDVTIVGDLTTSGSHTVDIFGANNVFVVGESNVSPEIVLDIQTLLDYSEPMPIADLAFVRDFCKNELGEGFPIYEANKPNKNALEEYEAFNQDKPNETASFELLSVNLYPVPANNLLNLHSSVELSNEKITILDLSGRILDLPIRKLNDQDFEINVAQLAVGSYYLTISSDEGQAKKLFMVAKNN